MQLLCIVQSCMRHRAAFVSLSIMYSNFAYSALTAVGIDSGIRWEEEVWKMAFFWQHHGHSRTTAVEKPNNDVKNDAHYVW